jgi:hypothetical protein
MALALLGCDHGPTGASIPPDAPPEGQAQALDNPQLQAAVARASANHANDYVLALCRGPSYDPARCKQHLRGRMMRYGCELNIPYEDLRDRWIASYERAGRFDMMPDDAFFAFLEEEDFCDPTQLDTSMDGALIRLEEDSWN